MLIECPKCGFSQPQDKYCASCGVDMETFHPKQPPALKKILLHPALHISIVFIFAFAAIFVIRQNRKAEFQQRVEFLKGGPIVVQRHQSASENSQQALANEPPPEHTLDESSNNNLNKNSMQPVSGTRSLLEKSSSLSTQNESADKSSKGAKTNSEYVIHLKAYYFEIDRETLSQWMQESQNTGQFVDFDESFRGVLPDIKQKLKSRNLQKYEEISRDIALTKGNNGTEGNINWFSGIENNTDPGLSVGIANNVEVSWETRSLKVDLEILRSFLESDSHQDGLIRKSYPASFELQNGSGVFITGILPKSPHFTDEEWANLDGIMKIFKSKAFKNNETKFTLVLEFDTPDTP